MQEHWVKFGWQGISCRVPEAWNLRALGGDHDKGHLRLEDGEHLRLELKWSQKKVDIEHSLEKYLKSLGKPQRDKRGKAAPLVIKPGIKIVSRRSHPDKEALGFSWQGGEMNGAGLIWQCATCGRTLIGQVRGYGGEDAGRLAKELFSEMEDHAQEGRQRWALYGLSCEIPEAFKLSGQNLRSGYLELDFSRGKETLRVRRWGPAAALLAENSLKQWLERFLAGRRREIRWRLTPEEIKQHAGEKLTGSSRSLLGRWAFGLTQGLQKIIRRNASRPGYGLGKAWHCPESNRIYLVDMLLPREATTLGEVVGSVACH
jgi:hypothetical protein